MPGARVTALAAVACVAAGCDREVPPSDGPVAAATGTPPPVDHLAPGELLAGSERAFGLTLPRDVRLESRFASIVFARGEAPVHALVEYFTPQVERGGLQEYPTRATFEHVKPRGATTPDLIIEIIASGTGSTVVEIQDVTPPPPTTDDLPNDKARWRREGLTPEGKLLDPTHLD